MPFRDLGMFKQTVYLGVTIDDGIPETADIEMRPRQAIVPVIAAVHAAKADQAKEAEYAEYAREAEVSHRAIGADSEIPVGGITIYFGLERDLPENWKICNGQPVNDPESRFDGRVLPDLQGLFVRGAASEFAVGSTRVWTRSLYAGPAGPAGRPRFGALRTTVLKITGLVTWCYTTSSGFDKLNTSGSFDKEVAARALQF